MMFKNPFDRGQFVRMNDRYDNQDIEIDNPSTDSARNHQFRDMARTTQLTQNAWNHSPYTREDNYNNVVMKPQRATKHDQFDGLLRLDRYQDPR